MTGRQEEVRSVPGTRACETSCFHVEGTVLQSEGPPAPKPAAARQAPWARRGRPGQGQRPLWRGAPGPQSSALRS